MNHPFWNRWRSSSKHSNINTQLIGEQTEKIAANYLTAKGLVFINKNFQCKLGEIDLIMREGQHLVFVEVRYRKSQQFGGAAASISQKKQQRCLRTAEYYLQKNSQWMNFPCRFDVILLSQKTNSHTQFNDENDILHIDWIKNAFNQ